MSTNPPDRPKRRYVRHKSPTNLTIEPQLKAEAFEVFHSRYNLTLSEAVSEFFRLEVLSKRGFLRAGINRARRAQSQGT